MGTAGADVGWDKELGDVTVTSLNLKSGDATLSSGGLLTVSRISGGIGGGTFTATAAALTTVSDTSIVATSRVIVVPNDATAGLLARSKTCYVSGIGAGFFTFVVSATGAGAPAGTEVFQYIFLRET